MAQRTGNNGIPVNQVIVFTGSGRGMTAAAIGVAARTISIGGRVIFVYFTGPKHPVLGEIKSAAIINKNWITVGIRSVAKEPCYLNDFSESVDTVEEAMDMALKKWSSECDVLVLDSITRHIACGSISVSRVIDLIDSRSPETSIILTGPYAPDALIERADVVTEFLSVKQPADIEIQFLRGIDF
ncbi:MAG TPA: cob(I)yrinic acid a,c-diamide adenosyltransferase [Dehalococcoidia bacterium]|nr:cob(I)yrinic acid a,c-diamide adenosyltransferase [Dehalococcoidia bacterium]